MDLAFSQVYGVATFYKAFSLSRAGATTICVCTGTACHVRNVAASSRSSSATCAWSAAQTTADGEFTLETVNCVGACALGPVVIVDGTLLSAT